MSVTACTTTAMRLNHLTGKRTNSLGWAKGDCHTCASRGRHCDRRRPRCSPCLAEGTICAGYTQELNWERGNLRIGKRRLKGKSELSGGATPGNLNSQLPRPSTYTFVDPTESQKRPRRRSRTHSTSSETSFSRPSPVDVVVSEAPPSPEPSTSSASLSTRSSSSTSTPLVRAGTETDLVLCPRVTHHLGDVDFSLSCFYSCFAYTTLTFPVNVNPWRACLPALHEEHLPCVRYAAVALAQRQQAHLSGKTEGVSILRLKAKALSLFASHLKELSFECGLSTALLLIALDYAETGVSNWTVHLRGAYRILETHGGIRLAESRPNLRAQIAMFIWYDVNAALISRSGPVFPRIYLEALMTWQADEEWSSLALNGLPDDMFLHLFDLSLAAAHLESVDSAMAKALQTKISRAKINEEGDKYQVLMSQVWRLGLLLYCARVFLRPIFSDELVELQQDEDTAMRFEDPAEVHLDPHSLALEILSMVSQIPSHSNFQKQCLMPIILAGCEISAIESAYRKIAIEYSERWKQKTGIWIFDSGLEFMRGVWARNDVNFVSKGKNEDESAWVPWTEIYPPSAGHGFLFG